MTSDRLRGVRPRALGLVGRFVLVSAAAMTVLGLVLAHVFRVQISNRAREEAARSAAVLATTLLEPQLTRADLQRGLAPGRRVTLDRILRRSGRPSPFARVEIRNRHGSIVYSDGPRRIGLAHPARGAGQALEGRTSSELSTLPGAHETRTQADERLLQVFVPLRVRDGAPPEGVFELYRPYESVARAIRHDARTIVLLLAAGLALLFGALFRLAAEASRRLRRQVEENEHQALHDPLTALPNRTLFGDRVEQTIAAARRDGSTFAVMLMDLDRFKEINDTLGHHAGDVLLVEVASRLREAVRESDTVARLGGDEFAILLRDVYPSFVAEVAERIHEALERPVRVEDLVVEVEASIGVALYPKHADSVETLLQRADVAMYHAKSTGSRYGVYDAEQDEYNPARLALVGELRRAIAERELVLHFQPKALVGSGEVRSVEALVRWRHPRRGLVPPGEFIPMAQRTGLIKPLTLYVLDAALAQVADWREDGIDLAVAVNLSPRSLHDVELPSDVEVLLAKWQLPPSRLQLEITEDSIMADPARTREVLVRLSELGVRLSIDDFGTGYSSLAYLRSLPMSELKIDRSFVMNMDRDENDAVIVRSTIDLGRNLGLQVVAEGVESGEILDRLDALGCDLAQGYFLSRPIPGAELAEWLRSRSDAALART